LKKENLKAKIVIEENTSIAKNVLAENTVFLYFLI